jgi:SAM-dependent methyltransferase
MTGDARNRAYDRGYFDKWYRNPRYRVKSPDELARQVAFVVAAAEHVLARPVRTVLDVGCGEGNWLPPLRRLRPGIQYTGVDSSRYVVDQFGERRDIRLGTIDALDRVRLRKEYDLILCVGMLNYLTPDQMRTGLDHVYERAKGLVYLEIFTAADRGVVGDTSGTKLRAPAWYRARIREAGFVSCGLHCYIPDWLREHTSVMERCGE